MPQFKALDFDAKQEDVINCATDKRTELATKKVPYPTPPHKIFDGISNRKVKKAVTGNKLLLKDGSDDKKKSKTNSIIVYHDAIQTSTSIICILYDSVRSNSLPHTTTLPSRVLYNKWCDLL